MSARVLQTLKHTTSRGIHRYNMMRTFATAGGDAGRKAVNGFMLGRARNGALWGAGIGAAGGFGMNAVGNMANGDSPFRGGLGATFKGALGGAALGSAGMVGNVFLGRAGGSFGKFAGSGAMGQFYRGSGGRALMGMARQDAVGQLNWMRGHWQGARRRLPSGFGGY